MVDTLKQPMGTQCIKLRANEKNAAWQTANKKQSVGKQPERCFSICTIDTQPRASAAGLNIEISTRGIHFSTCPPNRHSTQHRTHSRGGGWRGVCERGGRRQAEEPLSLLKYFSLRVLCPHSSLRIIAWSIANGKHHTIGSQ